ncbi:hypothetical protein Sru01_56010 [Sphaerisporangium rufum]|uniref:Guanylate cyclase domain-containing protein n=1 Tax=Sphaerisporangium rufum TaxID=1381558 RepID=A0A919R6N5_9ACTN|nr:hypothetical protein [Sphaerisporangium rufum]GII80619.1 hypothetical protein Sru01_56010 [Sphaerisporangium rufum]
MNDLSGEVRRLCVALDVERYSRRTDPEQREIQRRLVEVVAAAGREAGLDRLLVAERAAHAGGGGPATVMFRQEQGDGLLLLLPAGVSEARVIAGLIGELRIALHQHNRHLGTGAPVRLRLRLAFHQGPTQVGDNGFVGRAVNTVCRLRDSDELRGALTHHPDADLAVIVSAQLFEDVIEHEHRDLRRHLFQRVLVHAKDIEMPAWISVPDADPGAAAVPGAPAVPAGRGRRVRLPSIVNIDEY